MNNQQPTRFDYALRDLLIGDHDLTQLDHEQRVILIAELIEIQKAVEACGWQRHTGDWDWFVSINDVEGTNLELDAQDDYTACVQFAEITTVRVVGINDVGDPWDREVSFNIDELTTINIECNR